MQFTLKNLFIATTLIAIGIALWVASVKVPWGIDSPPALPFLLFFSGPMVGGMGAGSLFKHPFLGAFAGLILGMILFVTFMMPIC